MRALLWLVIGFSVLTTVASGWVVLLLSGSIASHTDFVGQLSPDADPTIISLPKGAILKEVHVPRNTEVKRGQTLATLDIDEMKRRIEEINAELLHDDLLRECLLIEEVPESDYFVDLPEPAQTQARLARQECQAFLHEGRAIQDKLETEQALRSEERRLIDSYIAVLSSALRQEMLPKEREEDSRQALALALLRNTLDREIADLGFEAAAERTSWQRRRLERIRLLGDEITSNTDMKRHMQALLEKPRLHAPEDGLVVQVRRVAQDNAMYEDVDLVVLRPDDGVGYSADFAVPDHQLDQISVGNNVRMRMLGMADDGPLLTGTISSINTKGQSSVRAAVRLDPESVSQLDDPGVGIALRGSGTASVIRVQKTNIDAVDVLRQALRGTLLATGENWFWRRVVEPAETAAAMRRSIVPGSK